MKCTQNSFCKNLEEKSRNFRVGGIKGLVKIVSKDNKVRMLYSTGSRDKGVEIIYCPFCGVKLKEDHGESNEVIRVLPSPDDSFSGIGSVP